MLTPQQVAHHTVGLGEKKCAQSAANLIVLGILSGMFIAFGSVGYNSVSSSIALPSIARLAGALLFPAGLAMTLVAGAELFTGNVLINMGVFKKTVTIKAMLRNWTFVYIGNWVGTAIISVLCFYGGQFDLFGGGLAVTTIQTGIAKSSITFAEGVYRGILCNILVCVGVWMSYAAESVTGKIAAAYFPIALFVLNGFEHCVANMYFMNAALLAKSNPAYLQAAIDAGCNVDALTVSSAYINNILASSIGNIIGGMVVAAFYYYVYVRETKCI